MYKSASRISILKYLRNDGLNFTPKSSSWIQILRRSSGLLQERAESVLDEPDELTFTSFLQVKQEQARRSFIVKISSLDTCTHFLNLCNEYGGVKNIFHYQHKSDKFLLIEMQTDRHLSDIMTEAFKTPKYQTTHQHFLVLKDNQKPVKGFSEEQRKELIKPVISATDKNSKQVLYSEIYENSSSLSETISNCYNILKVNDVDIRKRFLMCRQVEVICRGFLNGVTAYPFGSSVTGFGVKDCDLDIVLLQDINNESLFASENYFNSDREDIKKHLSVITELLQTYQNGCNNFFYIKHARVPIIKYKNVFTNLDCDLSLFNLHGVAMSQVLYMAGLDRRIRAIMIFLKLWAEKTRLVLKSPTSTLTNFSLCMLLMFFLQQIKMLPRWKVFPCNNQQFFLPERELLKIKSIFQKSSENVHDKSVGELLMLFFDFYSKFDFKNWGISTATGQFVRNSEQYPIFIENPLLPGVNISQNVNKSEANKMKHLMSAVASLYNPSTEPLGSELFDIKLRQTKI